MKLTTKLLLIFLGVGLLVYAGLVLYAVPTARRYLVSREQAIAQSNLTMAASEVRAWLDELRVRQQLRAAAESLPPSATPPKHTAPAPVPPAATLVPPPADPGAPAATPGEDNGDVPAETTEPARTPDEAAIFGRLRTLFANFVFHESGRLFLINQAGEFIVAPQASLRGRTVGTKFLYENGARDQLMTWINANRNQGTMSRAIEEPNEVHELVHKTLFVAPIARSPYYVCLAVDDDDVQGSADLMARILTLLLTFALGLYFVVFFSFYRRLKARLDVIVANARLVADGNYKLQVADPTADEIGTLARVIDRLAASLRAREAFAEQLRKAQKMELVGAVASGVAHDFNNILGGMRTAIDLCLQEVRQPANGSTPDLELLGTTLQLAAECAIRGRDSVERMVAFARRHEGPRTFLDLNEVISDLAQICTHTFDKRVRLTLHPFPGQAVVKGDRAQLEQVILNLCINARDAMQGGRGEITLTVERLAQTAGLAPLRQEGPHFRLTVQDNGAGMDAETTARMFEPFFTTKEGGSGLGLAMVFKVINEHHGWIDVQSELDVGTRFHLYLPQAATSLPAESADATTLAAPGMAPAAADPVAPGVQVLMIDDDPVSLRQALVALERHGCTVQVAPGAAEARRILAARADSFELVILDPLLPHLGEPDAVASVRAQQPRARLLLLGRTSRDPRIAEWLAHGCHGFLGKPWSEDDLLQAVRAALAAN